MSKNDERIIILKEKTKEKLKTLEELKKTKKEIKTNCFLTLNNVEYNLHILTTNQLNLLLIELFTFKKNSIELEIEETVTISSFEIDEWISDLKELKRRKKIKTEIIKLNKIEQELEEHLTNEKKVELKINELEKLLK